MSPIHVGELITEVTGDAAAAPDGRDETRVEPWDALERIREAARELERLHDRTRAEGFDA